MATIDNLPFLLNDAEYRTIAGTASATLTCIKHFEIFQIQTAGAETRTLDAPTKAGQVCVLNMAVDGGDATVTVTGGYDETGSTSLTFSDPGQSIGLISVPTSATAFAWRVLFNDGVAGPGTSDSFSVITFAGATGIPEIRVPSNLADALSIENAGGTLVAQVVTTTDAMALHTGDDVMLGVGTSNDARFSWDTTDANANEMLLQMPAGTATNVPVLVIGQSVESVDLGMYNGIVDPRFCWIGVGAVATGPGLDLRKARGTAASPTVVTSGDDLGTIRGYACVAAGEWVQSTEILMECTGTVATTRGPGVITFKTATDVAPSVLTTAMTISAAQLVTCAAGLTVTAGATTMGGTAYIGDTANANVTLGLTINQGAADDIALCLKSSDVATVLTTIVTGTVETDDYFTVSKFAAATGGTLIQALGENAAVTSNLRIESYGGQADATKSAAARGLVEIYATQHDGANALADIGADGNAFAVIVRRGSADVCGFIVDEDGEIHSDVAAATYDELDDLALVRAFDRNKKGFVQNRWDDHLKANEAELIEIGVLGAHKAEGGLVNHCRLLQLHNGALGQLFADLMEMAASLPTEIQAKLPERMRQKLLLA